MPLAMALLIVVQTELVWFEPVQYVDATVCAIVPTWVGLQLFGLVEQ